MKITGIETVLYEPKWDDPYPPRRRYSAVLRVHTDEGLTGISRTHDQQLGYIHDHFKPLLIGEDPRDVERLWEKMYQSTVPMLGQERAMVSAIGALDIALWDLFGKSVGLPCWRLLGGYRNEVPVYSDVPIRDRTPKGLGRQLADSIEMGYDAVKFHIVDNDPESIVEQVRESRAAIGPHNHLMVDIFRALDPRSAVEVAQKIEEYDIYWLEEPVRWHDNPLGLKLVAQGTRIPVAGGEGESTIYQTRTLLEYGGLTFIQPDTLTAGGYTTMRKIAALAEAYHVYLAPHGATIPELNAPIVAAVPNGAYVPATTPGQPPEVWAQLYEDFQIVNGRIRLTDRPGLGLEFNNEFLDRYQVDVRS
jgi:L-alanine-DL-glutamate epimerase-like enolase superfamily enzyme